MPVRKKSPGRWRVTIWFRGERKEWIVQGTRDDALSFEARMRVEIEQNARIEYRTVPTFYAFCVDKYVPHAQLHLKPSTWAIRRFRLASLIQFFGGTKLNAIVQEATEDVDNDQPWAPKHDRAREVPIDDDVAEILRTQRARKLSDKWVFPSREGGAYAYFPKRQFGLMMTAAGLRGGPHKLRHTFASLFLQTQPDLFLLAEILGHSSVKTTRIYAHLMPNHLARGRGAVKIPMPPAEVDPDKAAE